MKRRYRKKRVKKKEWEKSCKEQNTWMRKLSTLKDKSQHKRIAMQKAIPVKKSRTAS